KRGGSACGANAPDFVQSPKWIQISSVRVIPLEQCLADSDIVKNKRRFECTLLHERVHWVRKKAGLFDFDWDAFPDFPTEPGDEFEAWAYGDRLCTQDEIDDALLSYR